MPASTIVVTGANSGLGQACAQILAEDGERHVVLAVRDVERGERAAGDIRKSRPGVRLTVLTLDLAALASVRAFPARLAAAQLPPLRGLVCNAGLQEIRTPTRTVDGYESTFAVNHLGHFLLANLLLGELAGPSRIVFVSSNTHDPSTKTGMPSPQLHSARAAAVDDAPGEEAGRRRYTTSKLCNILCTYELARRLSSAPDPALRAIRVDAFDPGMMPGTGLARTYGPAQRFAWRYVLPALAPLMRNVNTVKRSGQRLASLASDSSAESARYISEGRASASSAESHDAGKALELWETSVELAHLVAAESPLV